MLLRCSLCHFHKELNSETVKEEYLSAILGEIENTDLGREFKEVRTGRGTPNTLEVDEAGRILDRIRSEQN